MTLRFRIVHSALMSGVLSVLMTAWITYINLGMSPDYLGSWMRAWSMAWLPAMLIAFFAGPLVMKLSHRICHRTLSPER